MTSSGAPAVMLAAARLRRGAYESAAWAGGAIMNVLVELKIQVSRKMVSLGCRPSSLMAPARHDQFRISCWPLSSTAAADMPRHAAQSARFSASNMRRSAAVSGHRKLFFAVRKAWLQPDEAISATRYGEAPRMRAVAAPRSNRRFG